MNYLKMKTSTLPNTGSLTAYMIGMFDDKLGYAEEKAQIKDYCVGKVFPQFMQTDVGDPINVLALQTLK